uniref:RING-type domain-containing protein n=1 Tax=Meloidogyne hapla TaxID=6305 RepID=A0A1I8B345_MELHA
MNQAFNGWIVCTFEKDVYMRTCYDDSYCHIKQVPKYKGSKDTELEQVCGSCKIGDYYCYDCSNGGCNTIDAFNNAFYCYYKGKGGWNNDGHIRKCDKKMCYAYVETINGHFFLSKKYINEGCGSCPTNTQCHTCNTNKCNKLRICLTYSDTCETFEDCYVKAKPYLFESAILEEGCGNCDPKDKLCYNCKDDKCNTRDYIRKKMLSCVTLIPKLRGLTGDCLTNQCYYKHGDDASCGKCKGKEKCYQCETNACNTVDAFNKAFYCYEREEGGDERIRNCAKGTCYISVDIIKAGGDEATGLKKYTKQGCGSCPSTSVPCRKCNTQECNTEKFFKEKHYCWGNDGKIEACDQEHKRFCYYALINDKKVDQGCGDKKEWTEKNVQPAKCQNKHLCNTKELFENSLFCNEKKSYDKEISKTPYDFKQCEVKQCYNLRENDGNYRLSCGKCSHKFCTNCNTNFCNVEEMGYKQCYMTNTNTNNCFAKLDEPCFTERTENGVNKGCGNCTSKTCISCNKHMCNDGKYLPYYCLDYDGKSTIECKKSDCYINKR